MWKLICELFLILSAPLHTGSEFTAENDDCKPQDLCLINTEECLRDVMKECSFFEYSKVYQDRTSESSFRITSHELKYKNWTFTVVENQKEKYETVKNCCNLKLNETCLLPILSHEDFYFELYALEDGGELCYRHYEEYPPEDLKFCVEDDAAVDNCISMENGVFVIKLKYYDASLEKISMDYCFFEMPVSKISRRNKKGLSEIDNEIVPINSSWIRINGFQQEKCRNESGQINIDSYASKNKPKDGYELCFTAKVRNSKWGKKAWCAYSASATLTEGVWTLAYTVVIAVGATFTLVLVMFLIYKMKLKKFIASYTKSEIPFQDNIAHIDENSKFLENECESYLITEIPDAITIGDGGSISPGHLAGEVTVKPQLHQDEARCEVNEEDDDTCCRKIKLLHGETGISTGVIREEHNFCAKQRGECEDSDIVRKDDVHEHQFNLNGSKHPCLISGVNAKPDYLVEKVTQLNCGPELADYVKKSIPAIKTFDGYVQKV